MEKPKQTNWLASRLSDGLCNRLFQIQAAAYHAMLTNKKLVFYVPRIQPSVHSDCTQALKLFPEIPIIWSAPAHETVKEAPEDFVKFKPLQVSATEPTVIEGYFQNWLYFQEPLEPNLKAALTKEELQKYTLPPELEPNKIWWIHIRLGDYQNLPHHQCADEEYWVSSLSKIPQNSSVFLFSDTPNKAEEIVKRLAPPNIHLLAAPQGLTAIQTLYLMSQCGGGCIGTNSTFSWWGMYMSQARVMNSPCILPKRWHRAYEGGPYAPWITAI